MTKTCYYEVLGVEMTADANTIKKVNLIFRSNLLGLL